MFTGGYYHAVWHKLELELTDATQYATVYIGDRPVATVRRWHHFDPPGTPNWTVYDLTGKVISAGRCYVRGTKARTPILNRVARHLCRLEIR